MEAELAALAASGATTLVGLMVSDAWTQGRQRLARFLARGGDESAESAAEEELRLSRRELTTARAEADEEAAADVEALWRARLRGVLRADPAAAAELRVLLDELAPLPDDRPVSAVYNTVSGGVHHGHIVMGRDFTGVRFGGPATDPATDPTAGPTTDPTAGPTTGPNAGPTAGPADGRSGQAPD
ncbi:PT domain-containing protein [Streptomyces corynorhini]|uniref:PT domain-containing protein n=1 Tax=Streptomyces corynorhini TaxID=2282652 RepID=UPI0026C24486|nr:PT domain-containing protein [Streptomyces corynorhini]